MVFLTRYPSFGTPDPPKIAAISRFAPLQFAFCSELRPGLVTPELLASVIDKIAAVASVTGWTLHDSDVRVFVWVDFVGFLAGKLLYADMYICFTTVCAYLFMTTILLYYFCGHSSSCLVSFDFCLKNMIRPVSHDRSTTKKGASDATMPQLGSTARLLKYVFY